MQPRGEESGPSPVSESDGDLGLAQELDEVAEILIATLAEIREEVRRIRQGPAEDGGQEAGGDPG
jgi:hypothetical protein